MTEQDLIKIKQTFPNLEIEDFFLEGEGDTVYMKFNELKVFTIKLEEKEGHYKSLIEDSSDGYVQIDLYESADLDDFLQQTKSKLATLFLYLFNQVK